MHERQREPYEVAIAEAWHQVDIYHGADRFLRTFGGLDPIVGAVFAANFCQSEVRNGGLHQFFSNPTGVLAPEALAAFRAMALLDAAQAVEEAMFYFGTPYPREIQERQVRLAAVPGKSRAEWDPFYNLDPRFYGALRGPGDSDRFVEAANSFVAPQSGRAR